MEAMGGFAKPRNGERGLLEEERTGRRVLGLGSGHSIRPKAEVENTCRKENSREAFPVGEGSGEMSC